jgi:hypothetical protein
MEEVEIMSLKIAIVGCGQIGSRHLQGLSRLNKRTTIYLVDKSDESIKIAKERFEDAVDQDKRGKFSLRVRNIDGIEEDLDMVIIATGSINRAELTKELVLHNRIKYIVFEKFLFQNKSDYVEIQSLLKENNIKAWVNQWMSSSEAFNEMLYWFDSEPEKVAISGNNWGMACNSVHFIDFFDSASNRKGVHIVDYSIDERVIKSKREGYFELTGKMDFTSDNNMKLNISSESVGDEVAINILIKGGSKKLEAKLSLGALEVDYYNKNNEIIRKKYTLPMQSESTGSLVDRIVTYSECELPTYQQSMGHHLLLFKCFENAFKTTSGSVVGCPVT